MNVPEETNESLKIPKIAFNVLQLGEVMPFLALKWRGMNQLNFADFLAKTETFEQIKMLGLELFLSPADSVRGGSAETGNIGGADTAGVMISQDDFPAMEGFD